MPSDPAPDEVNQLIVKHLADYDVDTRSLALEAIRLSERQSVASVSEQMTALIRSRIKKSGGSLDT